MKILNIIFLLLVLNITNCIKNQDSGSLLKSKRIRRQQIVNETTDCPQQSAVVDGLVNGYCIDTYTNETMKNECEQFDKTCSICFSKSYLSQCVKVCGTAQVCPTVLPEICTKNSDCQQCYEQVDSCLMCPTGLQTVIHANHKKECTVEDCPLENQYHPVDGCSRCNQCKEGCDKCSACGVCDTGKCQTNGFCSQGTVCVKKVDAKRQICSAADEYVSVNNEQWKKDRFPYGNELNCGEITCVKADNCGIGYFANKATGWCELCDYPYGKECSGPSPVDNALPFCWKKDDPECKIRGDQDCLQNYFFEDKDGKKNCYKSCEDTPVGTFATGLEDTNVALCNPNTEHCFCAPCHTGIKKCSGRNADDAIECEAALKLTESGTCVTDCGPGSYAETCSQTGIEKCYKCHKSCATCTNGAANSCITCKSPDFVSGGVQGESGVCYPTEEVSVFAAWMNTNKPTTQNSSPSPTDSTDSDQNSSPSNNFDQIQVLSTDHYSQSDDGYYFNFDRVDINLAGGVSKEFVVTNSRTQRTDNVVVWGNKSGSGDLQSKEGDAHGRWVDWQTWSKDDFKVGDILYLQ